MPADGELVAVRLQRTPHRPPSQETTITSSNVGALAARWSIPIEGFGDTPIIADGRLFLFGGTTTRAYSTITHQVLWTANVGADSAAVVGGQLFLLKSSNAFPTTEPGSSRSSTSPAGSW